MINETEIIDYMVIDEIHKSKLQLAISDHLDWQLEKEHLWLLQEKLNNYINYILNEEYKEEYKDEINSFEIIVFIKYKPKKKFEKLLTQFNKALKKQFPMIQIEITYQFIENEK